MSLNGPRYLSDIVSQPTPGVTLSCLPVKRSTFVHLTVTLKAGTGLEQVGEHGYFSLLSTLFARGCGELDRAQFAFDCDRRGSDLNFYPSRDYLTIEVWLLPDDLTWAVKTLKEMIFRPRLEAEEVVVATEEQLSQLLARKDEKRSHHLDVCHRHIYPQWHHYSRSLLGDEASLESADRDRLLQFHQRLVKDLHLIVCATGSVQPEVMHDLVQAEFAEHTRDSKLRSVPSPLPGGLAGGESLQIPFPVEQTSVLIALPAPVRQDPDYPLAQFCNELFGGAFLSRLTRAVRMKDGMAYSAGSRLRSGLEAGNLWLSLQTDSSNVERALQTVRGCIDELLVEEIPSGEYEHFFQFVKSAMTFDFDSLASLTSRRLERLLFGEPWSLEKRRAAFCERVTKESTEAMMRQLLQPEKAFVCLLGDGVEQTSCEAFHRTNPVHRSQPLDMLTAPLGVEPEKYRYRRLFRNEVGSIYRFPSGLHLLALPRPELGSVSLQVWTATGSMDEKPNFTGLSHLLEHLMFRGTKVHPDGTFDAILAQRGGLNNAFTTEDFTVYTDYVTPEGLEEALALEADRFRNLSISEEIFQTERSVVLEERSARVDCHPLGKAYEKLQSLALEGHPYGHPVIGWREDLEQMTLSDVEAFYRLATQPERLLIVIAGGCEDDLAARLVEKTFCSRMPTEVPSVAPPCWPILASSDPVEMLKKKTSELAERSGYSYLLMSYRFPREGHPDFEACELLIRILAEGDSSTLHEEFVRRKNQVLEVWASYEPQTRDHPLLHIGLATAEELDSELLLPEVSAHLAAAWNNIEQVDLDKAIRTWEAEDAFGSDDLEDWAVEIAGRVMLMNWDDVWRYDSRMEAVTVDDLKRVGRRYLQAEHMVAVTLHGIS